MSKKKQKNSYVKNTRLSEAKIRQIVRCFSLDLTALQTASICKLNRNTVNRIFTLIRDLIVAECEAESPFKGEVEADESYFGPHRVRGKRGRGAGRKTIVFGLLKREGKVYTEIIPDAKKATIQEIIRGKVLPESVIYTDGWRAYDGLVDVGYDKHFRVKHGENQWVAAESAATHINGIESFWSYAKRRMAKFNGIPKDRFYSFLKETEFRFNNKENDLYKVTLKILRDTP